MSIETVKQAIGIPEFKKTELLEIALTHPSYIYENHNLNRQQQDLQEREYRRLAILGDSILGAVVIDYLYDRLPTENQGALTDWKSNLVRRSKAYEFAQKLKLRQFCQLGGSQRDKHESQQIELFGEMFEALLGAIYLEFNRDFSRTRQWLVDRFIKQAVDDLLRQTQFVEEKLPGDCLSAVTIMGADEATELLWQMKHKADALVSVFMLDLEPELKELLQKLESELPDPKEERDEFEAWWKAKGQSWLKKIITVLGYDLQFTDEQKELLKQYYDANKLVLECLNSASNLTPEARENILKTLFLPK